MENFLNWLAYRSGILTERFQAWHLIVNYSILALALVVYLVASTPTWTIAAACVPGAVVFLISLQALAWKNAVEGEAFNLWLGV